MLPVCNMKKPSYLLHLRIPHEVAAELHKIADSHAPRVTLQELVRHFISLGIQGANNVK